jgi:peptide deformylase
VARHTSRTIRREEVEPAEPGFEVEPAEGAFAVEPAPEGFEVEPADEEESGEPELDPEVAARRAAALAQIRKFGDPVLRTKARAVERYDDALAAEVQEMGRLMGDALGVGLAATQVGVLHRLLVYRVGLHGPIAALVNPEVQWRGRESESMEEGCLSLPGVLLDVDRAIHVRVGACDERGQRIVVEASGLEARVIQHEIDHLDGVLILDRASREHRKEAMRAMREAMAGHEAA